MSLAPTASQSLSARGLALDRLPRPHSRHIDRSLCVQLMYSVHTSLPLAHIDFSHKGQFTASYETVSVRVYTMFGSLATFRAHQQTGADGLGGLWWMTSPR